MLLQGVHIYASSKKVQDCQIQVMRKEINNTNDLGNVEKNYILGANRGSTCVSGPILRRREQST